jgi:hypothetical protein
MEIDQNQDYTHGFPPFSKAFELSSVCFLPTPTLSTFIHVKIKLFVTLNSLKPDQDPDQDGSVLVWLPGSGYALR